MRRIDLVEGSVRLDGLDRLIEHRLQVGVPGQDLLLASEVEQVADDRLAAISLAQDDRQVAVPRVAGREFLAQHVGVEMDRPQGVVDLVRHPGRQLPDRRQLLFVDQLGLGPPQRFDHLVEERASRATSPPPGTRTWTSMSPWASLWVASLRRVIGPAIQ